MSAMEGTSNKPLSDSSDLQGVPNPSDAIVECAKELQDSSKIARSDEVDTATGSSVSSTSRPKVSLQAAVMEGVKSKRRPVLALSPLGPNGVAGVAAEVATVANAEKAKCLALGLGSRVVLSGLSDEEVQRIFEELGRRARDSSASSEESLLESWRHPDLRVALLRGEAPELELEAAAAQEPHMLVVRGSALLTRAQQGGFCAALRGWKGALLLLAEELDNSPELPGLIHALGVTHRWHAWAPAALPAVPRGSILEDLKLKQLDADESLAPLVAAAEALYEEHFHADLREDLEKWQGSMLGLMVNEASEDRELLGFIIYKFWGPPLRSMSVLRVAVPGKHRMLGFGRQLMHWAMEKARRKPRSECAKVALCALPEAIRFYERLGFQPITEDKLETEDDEIEDDRPVPVPGALWMFHKCGREYKPPRQRR